MSRVKGLKRARQIDICLTKKNIKHSWKRKAVNFLYSDMKVRKRDFLKARQFKKNSNLYT